MKTIGRLLTEELAPIIKELTRLRARVDDERPFDPASLAVLARLLEDWVPRLERLASERSELDNDHPLSIVPAYLAELAWLTERLRNGTEGEGFWVGKRWGMTARYLLDFHAAVYTLSGPEPTSDPPPPERSN